MQKPNRMIARITAEPHSPWLKGDTVTATLRGQTYTGVVVRVSDNAVELDMRPRVAGIPLEVDSAVPEGTIELRDGDRVIGTITNIE